jgi:uncharacterized membrane protein YqiK
MVLGRYPKHVLSYTFGFGLLLVLVLVCILVLVLVLVFVLVLVSLLEGSRAALGKLWGSSGRLHGGSPGAAGRLQEVQRHSGHGKTCIH